MQATKEKPKKTNNHVEIKSNFKPKSFFKDDSTLNSDGAELSFKLDDFLTPIYDNYIDKGFNLREIQQLVNISVSNIEIRNSIKLSENLYKEARQKVLDERVF